MFYKFLAKIVAVILSVTSLFSVSNGFKWADSMEGHDFPSITAAEKAEGDTRVMSFNVRYADNNGTARFWRYAIVAREILSVRPDVLGVQEALPEWMNVLNMLLPEYDSVGVGRDNGKSGLLAEGEHSAIFYRKDRYNLLDSGTFWISETPDEPSYAFEADHRRVCSWAKLEEKDSKKVFAVLNTHLESTVDAARVLGANMIRDFAAENFANIPVVVTGDFNSTENGSAYRILSESFVNSRYAAADSEYYPSFHDCAPENGYNLDYIMVSSEIPVHVYRTVTDGIDGRFVSDHFPIYADMFIPYADTYSAHDFELIPPAEKPDGAARIMSFNIRCSDVRGVPASQRASIVTGQIISVKPDSAGIQEATGELMDTLKKKLTDYAWVGLDRESGKPADTYGGEACPIFYLKDKYELLEHGDFWLSETPDEPSIALNAACKRICTWAKLKDRGTGSVYVHVNTHYDHVSSPARVFGANMVTAFINDNFAELPVVFTADMNDSVGSDAYAVMISSLRDARFEAADSVPYGTFHACSPETHAGYFIDFVLCSEDIEILTYRTVTDGIDGRFVSDHFPIYADIVL
ncbi:MAG: endonuclease/exonuclease/phosphatase family protein [Clostridia bacterium]|nr:endonuclease/exonuclease/phosphatase family protein [Clostridia bacterium]